MIKKGTDYKVQKSLEGAKDASYDYHFNICNYTESSCESGEKTFAYKDNKVDCQRLTSSKAYPSNVISVENEDDDRHI